MSVKETKIADILHGVICSNTSLEGTELRGDALLIEVINLATLTAGYYAADHAKALYRPPFSEMRTTANLRQLMEFGCGDLSSIHVAAFCAEALQGDLAEKNLALRTITIYEREHKKLSQLAGSSIPTDAAIRTAIRQSVGERGTVPSPNPGHDHAP